MDDVAELQSTIQSAASLLGLQLVLVTLFTSELARRLSEERGREGGSRPDVRRTIGWLAVALLLVTAIGSAVLGPLVVQTVLTCCSGSFQPTLAAFLVVWILLPPLIWWQLSIFRSSKK